MSLAPSVQTRSYPVAAAAITVDLNTDLCESPTAGTITGVRYTAIAAKTGADTNSRHLNLVNKGAAGSGTTVVATLALVSGVSLAADVPKAITLSVVANATTVAKGDVLQWQSVHDGTGITDPGGFVAIETSALTTPL